jgi:hypothetical protein
MRDDGGDAKLARGILKATLPEEIDRKRMELGLGLKTGSDGMVSPKDAAGTSNPECELRQW